MITIKIKDISSGDKIKKLIKQKKNFKVIDNFKSKSFYYKHIKGIMPVEVIVVYKKGIMQSYTTYFELKKNK